MARTRFANPERALEYAKARGNHETLMWESSERGQAYRRGWNHAGYTVCPYYCAGQDNRIERGGLDVPVKR